MTGYSGTPLAKKLGIRPGTKLFVKGSATKRTSFTSKASKVETDITEDTIREVALPMGLVDIKVCAVDDTWLGLKLVIRKERRN